MNPTTAADAHLLAIAGKWQNRRKALGDLADEIEPNPHPVGTFGAAVWDLGGPGLVDHFRERNRPRIEAVLTKHFNS